MAASGLTPCAQRWRTHICMHMHSVGMLEFIEDPPALLTTVASFLSAGGLLGVGAPEKQSFALEKRFGILTHPFEPMEQALRACSLECEWSEAMNGYTLDDGQTSVRYRGSVWRAVTAGQAAEGIANRIELAGQAAKLGLDD